MILDKIDEKRLLIALSGHDMKLLNITFNQLDWKNQYAQKIIRNLLARAEAEIGFAVDNNKLLIEAIPQSSGCFVLITLLSSRLDKSRKFYKIKTNSKPFTFFFKDAESLIRAIEQVYDKPFKIKNSSIIEQNGSYYVILTLSGPMPTRLQAILTEYGDLVGKSRITAARALEQGRLITKNSAIEALGKHLFD